ncbi:hypothetical protein TrVE_jg3525 [Triparma verrucosa]|uniref:Uncharacterized protein n=1 Tax=Triparma verrucosa TaxID=1606542 RepID=A0A9W7ELS3_9STRA|nr:hypothetical protein TrVE_jg3525 [Triparma verrucosa]
MECESDWVFVEEERYYMVASNSDNDLVRTTQTQLSIPQSIKHNAKHNAQHAQHNANNVAVKPDPIPSSKSYRKPRTVSLVESDLLQKDQDDVPSSSSSSPSNTTSSSLTSPSLPSPTESAVDIARRMAGKKRKKKKNHALECARKEINKGKEKKK